MKQINKSTNQQRAKRQLIKFLTILVMLFLFTTACEQDIDLEIPQTEAAKSLFKVKTVKLEEIPNIKDYLNSKTNNIFYKESTDKNGAIFDVENIMEVIDTLNYANYSFNFTFPDTPVGTFYNLVVGKTPEGEAKEPFVLKYVCDESYLDEFITNDFNFQYFKGKVDLHKYTDFFQDGNFYKGDVYCPPVLDANGDPIPCDKITVDSSNLDGTGSNSDNESTGEGGTTSGTGGDGAIVWSDTGDPDDSSNDSSSNSGSSGSTGGGGGSLCLYIIDVYSETTGGYLYSFRVFRNCPSEEKKSTIVKKGDTTSDCPDCPSPEGGIGINATAIDINTILGGILNNDQLLWLSTHTEEEAAIKQYLKVNIGEEANEFVNEAIKVLMNNGEADFDNEILKDVSFIGTKADCVLNALISKGNNIFKKTSQAFTGGRSKFKLKFTTYNNPADSADARTGMPESGSTIIAVEFNLFVMQSNYSIDLAGTVLHETIHAELHRIKLSNNAEPNPLPADQYDWYLDLWTFHEGSYEAENKIATEAEHDFMSNYFINPIASGLREFDDNTHSLENYKFYAWDGLQDYGKRNGFITQTELDNLAELSKTVRDDTHTNLCD